MKGHPTHIKILEKSKKLFACHGFDKTSTKLIAEAAGIKKPSLYYFFKNKEEIYSSIIKEIISDAITLFRQSTLEGAKLQAVLEQLLELSKKNGPLVFSGNSLGEKSLKIISQDYQELLVAMASYLDSLELVLKTEESIIIILDTSQMYAKRVSYGQKVPSTQRYSQILTQLLSHSHHEKILHTQ